MEKLVVDAKGRIVIPPDVTQSRGLLPGDDLTVLETPSGLLIYPDTVDAKTLAWWNSLTDDERIMAQKEARDYETLSKEERDAIWNHSAESLEVEAEGDEIELPTS